MLAVVGDETGLIKVVDTFGENKVIRSLGTQTRDHAVDHLCWSTPFGEPVENEIASGLRNGRVQFWNIETGEETLKEIDTGEHALSGLHVFRVLASGRTLLTCNTEGAVETRPLDDKDVDDGVATSSFSVGGSVSRLRLPSQQDGQSSLFAVGGKEHESEIWDLESKSRLFQAKNVKDDNVRLRVPVWVTDLAFLPMDSTQFAIVTGYHQVRLYDTRAKRRPVFDTSVGEHPLTGIAIPPHALTAVVSDSVGNISQVDLRTGRVAGSYKGLQAGGIRGMAIHPHTSLLASASLDRHIRVYNYNSRKHLVKIYLKQRLCSVLFSPSVFGPSPASVDPLSKHGIKFWGSSTGEREKYEMSVTECTAASKAHQPSSEREDDGSEDKDDTDNEDPYEIIFGRDRDLQSPAQSLSKQRTMSNQKSYSNKRHRLS
mmetsp:Transcript_40808/g.68184  ORF Transcript_40808/g.68184 Transcript_40808/m.68184 type:complete len:429 (+) Transcript_40808:132-1418(+)|eukprot:CAMPEP_0184350514 /NCGR_PEP_ID=MMETSP1089-20130417/38263_1 /TAXON_ID=38269 ORGANISM="Gloeochaete wittrockiana, Strain SAG46.84" /NCGR_SAMPLE_ID=MMETSP1089 /ASSEMBLY_ACC=CAM_ASM_000445 /LENGTH=428 /DNA_ID=CAMNT_0026683285 /DNA_START=98 /DNA_END=1384 /DNA_ORIENTATION=-